MVKLLDVIYRILKYTLIFVIVFGGLIYLSRTDRFPKILPEEFRLFIIDVSDTILSPKFVNQIYRSFDSFIDLLADDGYTSKYNSLPIIIKDRFVSEISFLESKINIFLSNPLVETLFIENLISKNGNTTIFNKVLKETFEDKYIRSLEIATYTGNVIFSSSSKETPQDEVKYIMFSKEKVIFSRNEIILKRDLRENIDFIKGTLILKIDPSEFIIKVANSEFGSFKNIYLSQHNGQILFSFEKIDDKLDLNQIEVEILGTPLRNKAIELYPGVYLGFMYRGPGFERYIFIAIKVLVFVGVILLLIWLNRKIVRRIEYVKNKEKFLIKELKALSGSRKNDSKLHNQRELFFLETAEKNLNFLENLITTQKRSESEKFYKHRLF